MRERWLIAALVAAPLLAAAGCGDDEGGRRVHPVRGRVVFRGEPVEGALVVFVPVEDDPDHPRPTGSVGADGSFRLTTYRADDGAPAGEYLVSVTWRPEGEAPEAGGLLSREAAPRRPDPLEGRFTDFRTSGLTATVLDRRTELPPFELD